MATKTVIGGKVRITHNLPSDAELRKMFEAVPILDKYKVADQVIRAGTRPIMKKFKDLIPTGTEEDRERRLKKQRGEADWETHLKDTVKTAVRTGSRQNEGGGIGYVGPEWDGRQGAGQKIYLIADWKIGTRQVFYWGKRPKEDPWTKRKMRNIAVDAADQTRPAQDAAMKRKLRLLLDQMWKMQGK